ncbi:MAG: hypothetical protein Q7J14_01080 [Candidatus Magasanikbacteria bacterium]|nr:hypothetical protein [Candidatus Magasanikbacteria bacterium]
MCKKANGASSVEEVVLSQFRENLKNLKQLLQKDIITINDVYLAVMYCRKIDASSFRLEIDEIKKEKVEELKLEFLLKVKKMKGKNKKWFFVDCFTKDTIECFLEEIQKNYHEKTDDFLTWYKKVRVIAKKNNPHH